MEPVQLGIIGTGIAAHQLHWPALQNLRDKFHIAVVCNHTEEKARVFGELVDAPYVLDYRKVLDNPDIEAVSISLPIHLNFPVTREALQAGKHVIVEKPLAVDLAEAIAMRALAEEYPGRVAMVAENYRYRPLYHRLRALVNEGAIGRPYSVLWNYLVYLDPSKNQYAQTTWRQNPRHVGGFVSDSGVHNIAVLRLILGEFATGRAFTANVFPAIGTPDTFSLQFAMNSGVSGVLNLYFRACGLWENTLHILGEHGTITVGRENFILRRENEPDREEDARDGMGYREEFEDFFRAIREGGTAISSFGEAYRDLEIILRAFDSAKTGEMVRF